MKKKIFIFCVVILAMAVLVIKRKMQIQKIKPYGIRPIPVRVAKVKQGIMESTHDYLSVVEAWRVAQISSRISARVDDVFHDEGDIVRKNEILLQLDDKDIRENIKGIEKKISGIKIIIDGLKTNYQYWAKENKRYKNLVSSGAIAQANADDVYNKFVTAFALFNSKNNELESLNHTRNSLLSKLIYTKITSPFDGLITRRLVDPGNLAIPAKILMTVKEESKLKLAFDAPQEDMDFLKLGLPVFIRNKKKSPPLKITHIFPSFDNSKMARVEIKFPTNTNYRIGSFIPISVVMQRHKNAVYVPEEALLENPKGGVAVFIVKNGKLLAQPVKKLLGSKGKVEITGVKPGEFVVVSTFLGWSTLSSGLKVEVMK